MMLGKIQYMKTTDVNEEGSSGGLFKKSSLLVSYKRVLAVLSRPIIIGAAQSFLK